MNFAIILTAAIVGFFAFLFTMSLGTGLVEGLRYLEEPGAAFLARDLRWPLCIVIGARVYMKVRYWLQSFCN